MSGTLTSCLKDAAAAFCEQMGISMLSRNTGIGIFYMPAWHKSLALQWHCDGDPLSWVLQFQHQARYDSVDDIYAKLTKLHENMMGAWAQLSSHNTANTGYHVSRFAAAHYDDCVPPQRDVIVKRGIALPAY